MFSCRPFKYEVTNNAIAIQSLGSTINNVGTVESALLYLFMVIAI